jgi:hypothetical protein
VRCKRAHFLYLSIYTYTYLSSPFCSVVLYTHTLIRPGYRRRPPSTTARTSNQRPSLAVVSLWRFTLRGALTFFEVNIVLCAWFALEVFRARRRGGHARVGDHQQVPRHCQGVSPLMGTVLVPLGFADASDVPFSCLGIQAYVELGAWLFVASLLLEVGTFASCACSRLTSTGERTDTPHGGRRGPGARPGAPSARHGRAARLASNPGRRARPAHRCSGNSAALT